MKKGIFFFLCGIFVALPIWGQEQDVEEIRTLLLTNDDRSTEWHEEITFMKRVNAGMPDGENWLVEWNNGDYSISRLIFVYVINNGEIIKRKSVVLNFSLAGHTEFDIMQDIPGTRIGDGSVAVYDYNRDGIDEFFYYGFYGSQFQTGIRGYDLDKDDFVGYCNIEFDIVDPVDGPAPVEFMTYKGMEGFKVYFYWYNEYVVNPPKNIINIMHGISIPGTRRQRNMWRWRKL
jgi:hypothetical protein